MNISIKNILVNIKTINNIMYISDADINRILYPKTRTASRGKRLSKDRLCDLERNAMIKINGIMFYPLNTDHIDNCYLNNKMLG
jgi:hypothetical protein